MVQKLRYLMFFVFAFTQMQAQDYQISFAGSGASSTVDTVEVTNLTQATSLTIMGTDILNLVAIVGIKQLQQNNTTGLNIYPNPATDKINIVFETEKSGGVIIELFDVTGKNIFSTQTSLIAGVHYYSLNNLPKGLYALTIKTGDKLFSGKILCSRPIKEVGRINLADNMMKGVENVRFKSENDLVQMQYNDGDLLLFRAYSENHIAVSTLIPTESLTVTFNFIAASDFDGNNYGTLTIGTQTWLADNMKTTYYPDGNPIPLVTDFTEWANLDDNNTDDAYCWYNNNEATYKDQFGAIYTYAAATKGDNSGSSVQGICPDGWHLPDDAEWYELKNYLIANGYQGIEGTALKTATGWITVGNGTDDFGFSAPPGGYRNYENGAFELSGLYGYWWSSTEGGVNWAWNRNLAFSYTELNRYLANKSIGFSVRCIKN